MKKELITIIFLSLFSMQLCAEEKSFIVMEKNKILKQEGNIKKRYSPESTFKIPLSLMGYDADILEDELHPVWPYKEEYPLYINFWKGSHNPRTWLRDSCVWFSHIVTKKLGMDKFSNYVQRFDYGNQDVSGDTGKNNGLTHSWLSSSLQISPEEQAIFIQKIVDHKLPVSSKSHEMTKKIMFVLELQGGWKLYGKTGNGRQLDTSKQKTDFQHGWFVGWIERNGRILTFANHIADDTKEEIFASFRAREEAIIKLWYVIHDFEKES